MLSLALVDELEVLLLEHEIGAEILLADNRIGRQFLGIALEEDASFEQEIGAVGDVERLMHVVVGDEDADVAVFQLPHDVLDVLHGDGVDASEGLVACAPCQDGTPR